MNTEALVAARQGVEKTGFLDIDLDPTLDLFAEIEKLKKKKMLFCLPTTTRSPISRT